MNINDAQMNRKKEEVMASLLKKSIVPTKSYVSDILKDHFDRNQIGYPEYKPLTIENGSVSNPKKWNGMFKSLGNDLDILYKCLIEQTNSVIANNELYLSEKENVFNDIQKLSLHLENLTDTLNAKGNLYTDIQCFNDFSGIEFDGDSNRNIPYTTSHVDLLQRKITNEKLTTAKDKINLNNSKISFTTNMNNSEAVFNGDISNILNDYSNSVFYTDFYSSITEKHFTMTIDLTLHSIKEVSTILFETVSVSNFDATLSVSNNGVDFKESYTITSNALFEWTFERQEIGYVRIMIEKNINDAFDNEKNIFNFIFKNISLVNDTYYLKSTYVSKPFSFNEILDTVTIKSNETIFPNTSISYFVAVDNGNNKLHWSSVSNNEKLKLGLLNKHEKIANDSLREYGIDVGGGCSSILKLKDGYNLNSINVYYGYQMWGLHTLDIPESENIDTYEPSIEDYTDYYVQRRSLVDTEEYRFKVRNGFNHVFTQYIYCDDVQHITNKFVKATNLTGDKLNVKVYLNNALINGINNNFNFTLKKGKNVVRILVYINASDRTNFSDIHHNFNFKENSFNVFADKPLRFLNNKTLREDSIENNNTYFSILDDKVIIKEDMRMLNEHIVFPKLSSDINYKNNSRYLIKYKAVKPESKENIKHDNHTTKIRVMANLISNSDSVSPKINSFRIVGD